MMMSQTKMKKTLAVIGSYISKNCYIIFYNPSIRQLVLIVCVGCVAVFCIICLHNTCPPIFQQYPDGIFGLGPEYQDNCGKEENGDLKSSCMPMLSLQVLILMVLKPLPKFLKDVILP